MKKFKLLSIAICAFLLGSCAAPSTAGHGDSFTMISRITALGEPLEVEVIEAPHGNSGPFLVLISDETRIFSSNGAEVKLSDLSVGQTIRITYGGQVMMSYPPRIVAKTITVES